MPIETHTIRGFVRAKAQEIAPDVTSREGAYDCLVTLAFDEFGSDTRLHAVVEEICEEYF